MIAKSNPNQKIILVDCDLRRSNVASALGAKSIGGTIDEYLSGAKPLEQVIYRDEESGVHIIPARRDTPNAAEILGSQSMRRLVEALGETYDLVILDTPPLMAVADARLVAELADYIVFLVRWERTSRELAINSVKLLERHRNVGVVLSQVDVRRHARYGTGDYGYYYSHYKYGHYYTE